MSVNNPNTPPRKETFAEMISTTHTPFYNAAIVVQENYLPYRPIHHYSIRFVEALFVVVRRDLELIVKEHNEARKIGGASYG